MTKKLRLLLGDQLNSTHSWFKQADSETTYLIAELKQETDYTQHHVQKIAAFFVAMQLFAEQLRSNGHQVIYLTLDETTAFENLNALLESVIKQHGFKRFEYQRPDEYRLLEQMQGLAFGKEAAGMETFGMETSGMEMLGVEVIEYDTEHFLLPFTEISAHFKAGKHKKMEFFYRYMRRRFNILMDGDKPLGDQWNFDSKNRNALKKNHLDLVPPPKLFSNSVGPVLARLKRHQIKHIGYSSDVIGWPVSREQALELLSYFCENCLVHFGRFQDAMVSNFEFSWSLFHSRLSFALNSKMLSPHEVIESAVEHFKNNQAHISLAQIEGFVRQILGWREYVRGVYWANMPEYAQINQLNANTPLPNFFWTGETRMNCLRQTIQQSLELSYAHHIQRLMVTGNFAMLTGLAPDEVDQWYLGIYIDAIEWVEMPNTRGMAIFADNGIIATKPYAASGNYINKMSDYCANCEYKVKSKTEADACPFNSLYWRFMHIHRAQLTQNPRVGVIYRHWDTQTDESRDKILKRAEWLIENIENI